MSNHRPRVRHNPYGDENTTVGSLIFDLVSLVGFIGFMLYVFPFVVSCP
jgi:hypothetical protein